MDKDELWNLHRLLEKFEKMDAGHLTEFIQGNWSRRNLDALIRDVQEASHS
jgi:hypothetical protein